MNASTLITDYFLTDALGSVRQLTDASGAITLAKSYQPYGATLASAGSGTSPFAFTGEQVDASGLTYLRARYYSSGDGRFLTRDTWMGDYNRPLSLNRWNYVSGNPVNYTDPSGKFANFPGCLFFLYNTLDCLSWYGAIPDYKGLVIVELYKSSFDKAAGEIMAAGLHPTTIAAAIAVQSQWLDYPIDQLQNALYLLKNSGCNIPWITNQLKSSSLGFAQMGDEEIKEFGSPFSMANSIKAMTARIRDSTSKCRNCAPIDIQIIAGMAQNGGFVFEPYLARTYRNKTTGRIDWQRYFSDSEVNKPYLTDDPLDIFNNNRAGWRSNFNTRFQLQLFTQDMMALTNVFGWGLPSGVNQSQLVSMWNLAFWGRE